MKKDEIIDILSDWNFWGRGLDTGISRPEYVERMFSLIKGTDQILAIDGVRRAGKSTLIRQLAKKAGGDVNTLIVNFEDERFTDKKPELLTAIYNAYRERIKPKKKPFIFLDEVQNVPGWERFARGVHERKEATIVVSGSSSKLLSSELATLLTGRHLTLQVYPLSLGEFLRFKGVPIEKDLDLNVKRTQILSLVPEYFEYGGFPGVVLSGEKRMILQSYFETIISRDVSDRFKIREREKIKTLARYYLTNIASPITFNSIAKFLKLPVKTVERFSGFLETACLIFFIKRFSFSVKDRENSARKVYSIDQGLSNAIGFHFTEKPGRVMENIVAVELRRRQTMNPALEICYWKDNYAGEVDYVLKNNQKTESLIQVCYSLDDPETKNRELKPLLKAMEDLKIKEGVVVTDELEAEEKYGKNKIVYIPLWKWLLT